MNKIFRSYQATFTVCTIVILTMLVGCSKHDDEETTMQRNERLLKSQTWKLDRLTVDDADQTALYMGMEITVNARTYTSANGEPVWPATGTWVLQDATAINRDNNMIVHIESVSETKLVLSLDWEQTTYNRGSRIHSLGGHHIYEMSKK